MRALGVRDDLAHTSIRIGLSRFTKEWEIDAAVDMIVEQVRRLRELSPLWEMKQQGIDLSTIQWSSHYVCLFGFKYLEEFNSLYQRHLSFWVFASQSQLHFSYKEEYKKGHNFIYKLYSNNLVCVFMTQLSITIRRNLIG